MLVFADIGFKLDHADGYGTHLTPAFCFVGNICLSKVGHDCVELVVSQTDRMTQFGEIAIFSRVCRDLCEVGPQDEEADDRR